MAGESGGISPEARRRTEGRFFVGLIVFLAFAAFYVVWPVFTYVALALLLSSTFFPLYKKLRKGLRSEKLAAGLCLFIVLLTILGPLAFAVGAVFNDAVKFASNYDPDKLNETVQQYLDRYGFGQEDSPNANRTFNQTSRAANVIGNALKNVAERVAADFIPRVTELLIGLLLMAFIIYYTFLDGEAFYHTLRRSIPMPPNAEDHLFDSVHRLTQSMFLGSILISALGGAIGAVAFWFLGVPNAIFWGFLMTILGILPVVGATMVWIPAAAYLYVEGNTVEAILLVLIDVILVIGFIDHVLRPRLLGKAARVHPVIVLIGVLGGVGLFGFLGFVLGPLVLALFLGAIQSYTTWHPWWMTEPAAPEIGKRVVYAKKAKLRTPKAAKK